MGALAADVRSQNHLETFLTVSGGVNECWPVHIRNLAKWGGVVQSENPVDVGTPIVLIQGPLRASGEVHHIHENILGIRFEQPINVSEWLPQEESFSPALPEDGSSERDRRVGDDLSCETIQGRVREEMAYVSRLIENVTRHLSDDAFLRARYTARIEELCTGNQMLRELIAISDQGFTEDSVQLNSTGPMRQRLLRKRLLGRGL